VLYVVTAPVPTATTDTLSSARISTTGSGNAGADRGLGPQVEVAPELDADLDRVIESGWLTADEIESGRRFPAANDPHDRIEHL